MAAYGRQIQGVAKESGGRGHPRITGVPGHPPLLRAMYGSAHLGQRILGLSGVQALRLFLETSTLPPLTLLLKRTFMQFR